MHRPCQVLALRALRLSTICLILYENWLSDTTASSFCSSLETTMMCYMSLWTLRLLLVWLKMEVKSKRMLVDVSGLNISLSI